MGGLVQPSAPPRAHRQHSSRRSRGALLCPNRRSGQGSLTQTKLPPGNPAQFTQPGSVTYGRSGIGITEPTMADQLQSISANQQRELMAILRRLGRLWADMTKAAAEH